MSKEKEIVINICYGGFGLSNEGFELYLKKKGIKFHKVPDKMFGKDNYHYYSVPKEKYDKLYKKCKSNGNYKELNDKKWFLYHGDVKRDDPALVEVVKELGEKANGDYSELKVVQIPDDIEWTIEEYDGTEWVSEQHETWR